MKMTILNPPALAGIFYIWRIFIMKDNKKKKQKSFSKVLLIQETILIWMITFICLGLALLSIMTGYVADFTWLATMIGFPWTAYGISQAFYYRKSQKENT